VSGWILCGAVDRVGNDAGLARVLEHKLDVVVIEVPAIGQIHETDIGVVARREGDRADGVAPP
jgi:hypothetical protein